MANQFGNPLLAPDLLKKQYQMQLNAQRAKALMEQSDQPLQGQMVSGHYVAPSWTQQLGQALQRFNGERMMNEIPQQMADIQRAQQEHTASMFAPQQNQGGQSLASGVANSPANQRGAQLGQALAGKPAMPYLFPNDPQRSMMAYQAMGPGAYLKAAAQQSSPTDLQKNLIAQGIQPGTPQWNQALGANLQKQNYIAPISAAPGSTLVDPMTGRPTFNAPQDGRQVVFDQQGSPYVQQVPGWNEAEAAQAQAQAAGAAAGKVTGEYAGKQLTGEKRREAVRAASGIDASAAQLGRLKETVDLIKNHPGFEGISGLSLERLSSLVPGTPAADAAAQFKTLKSQIAQNVLQMYRQMSETGGAVGQVSNAEQELFQNNIAALDTAQSPEQLRKSLDRIGAFVDESISRLKTAYDREYGAGTFNSIMGIEDQPAGSGDIPTITSQDQLRGLPSGTVFRAPDGSMRKVP